MRRMFKGLIGAAALASAGMMVAQPAQARDNTGVAVAAGIVGLGVGAAIASDNARYTPVQYYGGGYGYRGGGGGYYAQPYGYGYRYDDGRRGWERRQWRDERRRERAHDRWERDRYRDSYGWRR